MTQSPDIPNAAGHRHPAPRSTTARDQQAAATGDAASATSALSQGTFLGRSTERLADDRIVGRSAERADGLCRQGSPGWSAPDVGPDPSNRPVGSPTPRRTSDERRPGDDRGSSAAAFGDRRRRSSSAVRADKAGSEAVAPSSVAVHRARRGLPALLRARCWGASRGGGGGGAGPGVGVERTGAVGVPERDWGADGRGGRGPESSSRLRDGACRGVRGPGGGGCRADGRCRDGAAAGPGRRRVRLSGPAGRPRPGDRPVAHCHPRGRAQPRPRPAFLVQQHGVHA